MIKMCYNPVYDWPDSADIIFVDWNIMFDVYIYLSLKWQGVYSVSTDVSLM